MLLDTAWDVDKIRHCSKSFRTVLTTLSSSRLSEMETIVTANKIVFRSVVSSLGGNDIFDHVDALLESTSIV
jgi:hypothetical protein